MSKKMTKQNKRKFYDVNFNYDFIAEKSFDLKLKQCFNQQCWDVLEVTG